MITITHSGHDEGCGLSLTCALASPKSAEEKLDNHPDVAKLLPEDPLSRVSVAFWV